MAQTPPGNASNNIFRVEMKTCTESEYGHTQTNQILVTGSRKITFQTPPGWTNQLIPQDKKIVFFPPGGGEAISLQLLETNKVSYKLEAIQTWFKENLPGAQNLEPREIFANGIPGRGCVMLYTNDGRWNKCQAACLDLSNQLLVVAHQLPGTNRDSAHLTGVLNSLTVETNAPAP